MTTDAHRETYRQEAGELLADLEEALLELEGTPDDPDLVGRAFRAMHTIKGSGAMFGFDEVAAFTHELETTFDRVRNGELQVSKRLVDVGLAAKDHIRTLLDGSGDAATGQALLSRLQGIVGGAAREGAAAGAAAGSHAKPTPENHPITYRIRFRPAPDLFATGTDPLLLLDELRSLGTCHVVAQSDAVPAIEDLDPQDCYVYWDVILTTDRGQDAIRDVFIFVEDDSEVRIEAVDDGDAEDVDYKKLGHILVERGDLTVEAMETALHAQKRFGEILEERAIVPSSKVTSALAEQQAVRQARQQREAAEVAASVRVPAAKLDTLVDLVGELVIAQARLTQTAAATDKPELLTIAEEVERLSGELRDTTLNIRMLPIGTTFGRFRRLVRDLSGELGKEIELVTEGAETELDKTVIERLGDPLVHLIRNSIDHGIEPPAERERSGKPRKGTVRLSAAHSGANVVIEIIDDGKGLDPEMLRAKGVEKGLIAPDAQLAEEELFGLILLPGFSTAKTVSNVSGRGVGMDVVKRSIDALRGAVSLRSRRGEGTTVTIRLPLTLAIIEGLLVGVGGERFVLPLSLVEECVELSREDQRKARGRHLVPVRGELVPYIRLRESFSINGQLPEIEQIVVANLDGSRLGFVVDHVVGQHQTVIKSLGRAYRNVQGLSGATILGDGTVALILDISQLAEGTNEMPQGYR